MPRVLLILCALLAVLPPSESFAKTKPGLTYTDLMQVRKVFSPTISHDGSWIAFEARPDRGDGEVIVRATRGKSEHRIEFGSDPQLSVDGAHVAAKLQPPFAVRETTDDDSELHPGAVLLRTSDGERLEFTDVQSFGFSADGRWFLAHIQPAEAPEDTTGAAPAEDTDDETEDSGEAREAGGTLVLHRLADGAHFEEPHVAAWSLAEEGAHLALARATEDGADNALVLLDLSADRPVSRTLHAAEYGAYSALTWAEERAQLAFVSAVEPEKDAFDQVALYDHVVGADAPALRLDQSGIAEGLELSRDVELRFSRDGERLFFGLRDAKADEDEEAEAAPADSLDIDAAPFDPYDFEAILADRGVDVWHVDDPRIKTHEKNSYKERSEHEYLGVVHRDRGEVVMLAGAGLREVAAPDRGLFALGRDESPYAKLMTWDGFYHDAWVVDVVDGERSLVAEQLQDTVSRSPGGAYVAYYRDATWFLYDTSARTTRDLSSSLGVSFADEDHDYPRAVPDYGVGGWLRDDSAVLIYDKYDIWRFDTATGAATCLTGGAGRTAQRSYRVAAYDRGEPGLPVDEKLLLTGFDERAKNSSIWSVTLDGASLGELRQDDRYYAIHAKARDAEFFVYSEERYDVFPDLWVAGPDFRKPRRLTDVNPQLADFDLGRAELVEWASADGVPLQGILIKPANYDPEKRYPVLLYFYRFFSQRLHRFNDPVINHRPSFYVYAGDGYCVFLPDVRFDIGLPGSSATKCLVPGVQKLVDMGVADPEGVALHGHSWSGYQAAHVITQTNAFACAVAGAPVSNMTSAYGGIRWGTGLSRQFQYEKSQSRIGADLWSRRDLYIENSPLFFADRIQTPLLMQFGDEDEAVPWTQGIEMYMAMRRLQKPAVMLQYRGEPHHLKKYPNKLDYSLKMKAFIDHFCKGGPAPAWWTEGVAYDGE